MKDTKSLNPKNPHAQKLARLAKGVPKVYTPAELDRKRERLARVRGLRWPKKDAMPGELCAEKDPICGFQCALLSGHKGGHESSQGVKWETN